MARPERSPTVRGRVAALGEAMREMRASSVFACCSAALLVGAIFHAAWACEDAFITLRTVDNWVHGYGLRWNIAERVQSYTHPLWLLCLTPLYWLTRQPLLSLIAPSIVTSAAFIALFVKRAEDRWLASALLLLLTASKAFVEFSSPGLENPLVHLLLLVYAGLVSTTLRTSQRLWPTVLAAALLLTTRADQLWLIGPSLAAAAWLARAELLQSRTWLALAPLALWEAFSLAYYGFPVPNTAYAKLSTGVPLEEAVTQGFRYFDACWRHDPFTVVVITLGFGFGLASRRRVPVLLALGLLSWQLYLLRVGADFMLGRLLTPALVLAVLILLDTVPRRVSVWAPGLAAAMALSSLLLLPRTPLWGRPQHVDKGWLRQHVTDERGLAYATLGLWREDPVGPAGHEWVTSAKASVAAGQRVLSLGSVGIVGYFVGPTAHILDEFGLCDPLLARLPAEPAWSPGHFQRLVPEGYVQTLETGENHLADPTLAARYAELSLITRGELFSAARWQAIWRWNTTARVPFAFDYGVRAVPAADAARAPGDGAAIREPGVLVTGSQGLAVLFDSPTAVQRATVTVGGDDRYLVAFRSGKKVLWETWLEPSEVGPRRLSSSELTLPHRSTIDSVLIRGRAGDYRYHVGSVQVE